jgi:hypothetical protein
VVLDIEYLVLVCDRSSVYHYFKLKPRGVVLVDIKVLKQSENEVRHEVHPKDRVQLLLYLGVCLVDQYAVNPQLERVQESVDMGCTSEVEACAHVSPVTLYAIS